MVTTAEYGSWKSKIGADTVTRGNCKTICELRATKDSVFWIEQQFPDGRCTIFESNQEGHRIEWTPNGINVRNFVHEYGGGSFTVVDSKVYFITPNGIFRLDSAFSKPKLITAGSEQLRFADLFFFKGHLYVVHEIHSEESRVPQNIIAKISSDGTVTSLVTGADFYASPRVSPDGRYISWMEWNLPSMPWDDTSVVVAEMKEDGGVGDVLLRLSQKNVNFHGAEWNYNSQLFVISDISNWWNLYNVDLTKKQLGANVLEIEREIGSPAWQFADRQYATNQHGILMNVSGRLYFKWQDGRVENIENVECGPYTQFSHLELTEDNIAYCIASGPTRLKTVLRIDIAKKCMTVVREARDGKELDSFPISVPKLVEFDSDSNFVSGWFYPPFSLEYEGPQDALPPVILMAHGGPTDYASDALSMKVQFFTSRGFAVFDVNYRGSTRFGTAFRNLLKKNWGIVDRNDMINAAKFLTEMKLVDANRICIMGSSAGGYLLLSAILESDIFAAAASLYGVSDLVGLCKDTHKFELGYNEQLVGKYPEEAEVYESRSPINKIAQLACPIAFFHGDGDRVVPVSQSIALYEELKAKGVPTALVIFPGEGHGFRGSHATEASLNGIYYFFCRVLQIAPSVKSDLKIVNLLETQETTSVSP